MQKKEEEIGDPCDCQLLRHLKECGGFENERAVHDQGVELMKRVDEEFCTRFSSVVKRESLESGEQYNRVVFEDFDIPYFDKVKKTVVRFKCRMKISKNFPIDPPHFYVQSNETHILREDHDNFVKAEEGRMTSVKTDYLEKWDPEISTLFGLYESVVDLFQEKRPADPKKPGFLGDVESPFVGIIVMFVLSLIFFVFAYLVFTNKSENKKNADILGVIFFTMFAILLTLCGVVLTAVSIGTFYRWMKEPEESKSAKIRKKLEKKPFFRKLFVVGEAGLRKNVFVIKDMEGWKSEYFTEKELENRSSEKFNSAYQRKIFELSGSRRDELSNEIKLSFEMVEKKYKVRFTFDEKKKISSFKFKGTIPFVLKNTGIEESNEFLVYYPFRIDYISGGDRTGIILDDIYEDKSIINPKNVKERIVLRFRKKTNCDRMLKEKVVKWDKRTQEEQTLFDVYKSLCLLFQRRTDLFVEVEVGEEIQKIAGKKVKNEDE